MTEDMLPNSALPSSDLVQAAPSKQTSGKPHRTDHHILKAFFAIIQILNIYNNSYTKFNTLLHKGCLMGITEQPPTLQLA